MLKFVSKITGSEVVLFQERVRVGTVSDVLISPLDGTLVGLEATDRQQRVFKYIPPSEIKGFGDGFVMVKGASSLSNENDVVKIKKFLKERFRVIGAKVYYENGEYIGKVSDSTINFKFLSLENIYVNPKLSIKFFSESLIIPQRSIIKIEKNKIFIKDREQKIIEPKLSPKTNPAIDI